MKKVISFIVILAMMLSVSSVAMAEVNSQSALKNAINAAVDGNIITLTDNINITSSITIDKNITIDGGGKTIRGSLSAYGAGFVIDGATDVTIKNITIDLSTADRGIWVKTGNVNLILDGVKFVDCGTAIQAGTQPGDVTAGFDYSQYAASSANLTLTIKGTEGADVFGAANGLVIRSGSSVTLTADCDTTLNGMGYIPMYDNTKLIGNSVTTITGMSQINVRTGSAEIKNLKFDDISNGNNLSVITGSADSDDVITISGCTFGDYDYDAIQITPKADGVSVNVTGNTFSGTSKKEKRAVHIEGLSKVSATVKVSDNEFDGEDNPNKIEISNFRDTSTVILFSNSFDNTGYKGNIAIELYTSTDEEAPIVAVNSTTGVCYTTQQAAEDDADEGEEVTIINPDGTTKTIVPKPASSGIKVEYNGGNSFSTSKSDVPTGVEIDGVAVPFSGTGSNFTVGCVDPGAKWVTVRWNSTSVTTNFTPDGLVECSVSIPKTGDISIMAYAMMAVVAAAGIMRRK